MSISTDPLQAFPREISLQILSYLDMPDLASCCQVNTTWERLANEGVLWARIEQKIFNSDVLNITNLTNLLRKYKAQMLNSNEEILKCIQSFVDRISLGQNAKFRCIFSPNSRHPFEPLLRTISIEFKGSRDEITNNAMTDFDFKEDCFAINGINNGRLTMPQAFQTDYYPSSYCSSQSSPLRERIITYTVPAKGPFQATLSFPNLDQTDISVRTEMQSRIENILRKKLGKLSNQHIYRKVGKYGTSAAGVILLTAYIVNHCFFTANVDR